MKGKEVKEILSLLAESASRIVLTSSHKERGFTANELSGFIDGEVEFYEDPNVAYQKSLSLLDKEILVVTGSHFLVSELLKNYF
jgi:folylpolyglutamate synthase/dihydropteroate synthase